MSLISKVVDRNRRASKWIASRFPRIFAKPDPSFRELLLSIVTKEITQNEPKIVLEAGGVDRPLLERSTRFEFVGLDIEERPDCAFLYDRFVTQSIEEPLPLAADVIISFTLLEHVPNNEASIQSMFTALNPGGATYHYVPSGLHLYSLALRAVGPRLPRRLIPILRPGTEEVTGYPAFFNLCTPSAMRAAFQDAGFTMVNIQPFYRANDYFAFFTPAFIAVTLFENICRLCNLTALASGFVISARKPLC